MCKSSTTRIISSSGKFVALGWGKKETQFHGSEGKQAAHRKQKVFLSSFEFNKASRKHTFQTELKIRFAAIPASILNKPQFTMCPAYPLLSISRDPGGWEG